MSSEGRYIIGVDIGSSNIKAVVFSLDGSMISKGSREIEEYYPEEYRIEQDAEEIWLRFTEAVQEAVRNSNVPPQKIIGIGLDSNRCGCLLLDKDGKPLNYNITWRDTRAAKQVEQFRQEHPEIDFYHITGEDGLPQHTVFKLMWMMREMPEVWAKTGHICLSPKDYVIIRLLDICRTSKSIAQSSGLFDINTLNYSQPILRAVGIDENMLPDLFDSDEIIGRVDKKRAQLLGLSEGTPVICGLCDATASQVGSGSVKNGLFTVSIGTCGAVRTFSPVPIYDACKATQIRVFTPYGYVPSCTVNDAGGVLKWFRNQFGALEQDEADRKQIDVYKVIDEESARIAPGCDGLLLLSNFTGSSFADKDENVFGAFVGIRNYHTRAHFMRAIMEGVAMSLRSVIAKFRNSGFEITRLSLGGGGARSDVWMQILADVLAAPIEIPECEEAGCLGSAIMVALGLKVCGGLDEAVAKMVRFNRVFTPNQDLVPVYDNMYKLYSALYGNLHDSGYFRLYGSLVKENMGRIKNG